MTDSRPNSSAWTGAVFTATLQAYCTFQKHKKVVAIYLIHLQRLLKLPCSAIRDGSFFRMMRISTTWEVRYTFAPCPSPPIVTCANVQARFDKQEILRSYETALEGADVVVGGALSLTPTMCVAEKLGVPW